MKTILPSLLSFFLSFSLFAQQQVTDFSSFDADKSSTSNGFIEFKGNLYFHATHESYGREIWVSDGTDGSERLLKDIFPGKGNGAAHSLASFSAVLNENLYFFANNGVSGIAIWKTDGTDAGTEPVSDAIEGSVRKLTRVDDHLFFTVKFQDSLQIWKSDGTKAGIHLVDQLHVWNTPTFEGTINDLFMFTAQNVSSNNSNLWRSDGTSAGTYPLVEDFSYGGSSNRVPQYHIKDNELYFVIRSSQIFGNNSVGLMKTDGSLENTTPVLGLVDGNQELLDYADVLEYDDQMYFSFFRRDRNELFIWQSDGTEEGTELIYSATGWNRGYASNLAAHDRSLLFLGPNQIGGTSIQLLNIDDLTLTDLQAVSDETALPNFATPHSRILQINDHTFFVSVVTKYFNNQCWMVEFDPLNVRRFDQLDDALAPIIFNQSLFVSLYRKQSGREIWISDGTEANTRQLHNINPYPNGIGNSNETRFPLNGSVRDLILFPAIDSSFATRLWSYHPIYGLAPMSEPSSANAPQNLYFSYMHLSSLYFVARDSLHGYEFWRTDGTPTGTEMVIDIEPGVGGSFPSDFTSLGNDLYFEARQNGTSHLFRYDGAQIEPIAPLSFGNLDLISVGEHLYFSNAANLWISDGTAAGTRSIKDSLYTVERLTKVNGKVFFVAQEFYLGGKELWITDGTEVGTYMVKDIGLDHSSDPNHLIAYDNRLFFTASTPDHGREVWVSDGTEAGTQQIADIFSGVEDGVPLPSFCVSGDYLFFVANDGMVGPELWKTDGTSTGTSLVKDIHSGSLGAFPFHLTDIDSKLYFRAYDPQHGDEPWSSDGTEAGTSLLADIQPGILASSPSQFTLLGKNLYFIAETLENGAQLWAVANIIQGGDEPLLVYPNPTSSLLTIETQESVETLRLYGLDGRLIKEISPTSTSIDIEDLAAGTYLLVSEINGETIGKKIIKR